MGQGGLLQIKKSASTQYIDKGDVECLSGNNWVIINRLKVFLSRALPALTWRSWVQILLSQQKQTKADLP